MRVRKVTVWKHEKFTIIPRKRWQSFRNRLRLLLSSVEFWLWWDGWGVYWYLFTFSMESVDQVGRRERFMQSNFESLSGGDDGSNSTTATNSISNAWREGGSSAHQRNAGTIGEDPTDCLLSTLKSLHLFQTLLGGSETPSKTGGERNCRGG